MASYFGKLMVDNELNIQTHSTRRSNTYNVDLDDFMQVQPRSSNGRSGTTSTPQDPYVQMMQTINLLRHHQEQMQNVGDVDQEQFLDNLVSQLLEESQRDAKGPPPASQRFIQAMPVIKKETLDSEETCIICKDVLQASQDKVTKMPCGHYFDQGCIQPWLELHNSCPMCRFQVETEEQVKQEEEEEARSFMYG
ncbi:hypothetical protein DM01DRAFT_1408834 [Hesseltinella vesiculosa]|uniref:RING-type domain-containing protein n=1 Tax=Hesseltinella vesiculosa TaxID=101127 RepID=A0A1X2GCN8_9FUNG|nr:hypothetical protein DM01DRAFT_1408834 [Hesseltinella vesiculosa]